MALKACELLASYVEKHNASVLAGDAETRDALFADGTVVEIEAAGGISELRRRAIVSAFLKSELLLWHVAALGDDVAFANYAWREHPRLGGLIRMQRSGDRIRRLTLRPGYSRIFALLDGPERMAS